MQDGIIPRLPVAELRKLDFLIGDSSGQGVLCPPMRLPVPFSGYMHVEREECDRFMRMDFFGQIPFLGTESIHSLITYSDKHQCYRMWSFASSQEDPMLFRGNFSGDTLTFVSEPMEMVWGIERMRCSFCQITDGVVEYCAELWTIDGYQPYFRAVYSVSTITA